MLKLDTTSQSKFATGRKLSDCAPFCLVVAVFLVFFIQTFWRPFKEVPLAGATASPTPVAFNHETWFEGDFQTWYELKLNLGFGFRSACVRIFNQLRYSLFQEMNPQITKGDDGYFFETAYKQSVCGVDFIGTDSAFALLNTMDAFRDTLLSQGKRLVVLIAPNKWRTLSDKVNWDCKSNATNYSLFVEELKLRGYSVMDGIAMFEFDHAAGPAYPLHSKQGTHWSIYGAAASITYLNYAFKQEGMQLPEIEFDELEITDVPRNTDKDLHDLLNIMTGPQNEELAYPKLKFEGDAKPRVLVVGDSYYWSYYYLNAHQGLFARDSKFFYYNKSMYGEGKDIKLPLDDNVRKAELQSCDAVLFVISEPSLCQLGFGLTKFFEN